MKPRKWLLALCVLRRILPDCGLENAQKRQWIVMGCVRLFRVEEGCVPWHGKWRTLIPQELWPVIYFSWTEKSSAILLGRFDDPLFSSLSPFRCMSHKHTRTLPSPSQHLLLQPGSEQGLLAFPHKLEPLIINSHASGWGGMTVETCTMVHSEHTKSKIYLFATQKQYCILFGFNLTRHSNKRHSSVITICLKQQL